MFVEEGESVGRRITNGVFVAVGEVSFCTRGRIWGMNAWTLDVPPGVEGGVGGGVGWSYIFVYDSRMNC